MYFFLLKNDFPGELLVMYSFSLGSWIGGRVIIGREYKLNGLVERGQRCSTLYMFTLACTSC